LISTIAIAAVDRIVHHGVIFEIKSESYRRQVATIRSNKSKAS
jgi:DNA replication protein DnaC